MWTPYFPAVLGFNYNEVGTCWCFLHRVWQTLHHYSCDADVSSCRSFASMRGQFGFSFCTKESMATETRTSNTSYRNTVQYEALYIYIYTPRIDYTVFVNEGVIFERKRELTSRSHFHLLLVYANKENISDQKSQTHIQLVTAERHARFWCKSAQFGT